MLDLAQLTPDLANPQAVGRTEADIQSDIKALLLSGPFNLQGETPRLEEQIGDGTRRRIDIALGATVIEVKKRLTNEEADTDYIEQLRGYVSKRMSEEGSRYNGILTDGKHWWLYELSPADDTFVRRSTFELADISQQNALVEWLQAVLATRHDIAPSKENIEKYLGVQSPAYQQDSGYLQDLYDAVRDNPTVKLKRDLWARLLRSALGTAFNADDDKMFIDHTLLVVEASVIGHAVMGLSLGDLVQEPQRLLNGEEFRQAGVYNVIESGFFDWILMADEGRKYLSRTVQRIQIFNWENVDHDVLKILYESVINADVRKKLGEYYTPDWLAEGVTAQVVTEPLEQSVLDPACGSGTFLFSAIRRIIAAAKNVGWDSRQIVEHVQNHVFGLDIHPVSVMLARVTYLLALGDCLQDRGDLWVPVHLGDSMQWSQPADQDENMITISTEGFDLAAAKSFTPTLFPAGRALHFPLDSAGDTDTFDQLVSALTERAKEYTSADEPRPAVGSVLRQFGISEKHKDFAMLEQTFNTLCDLNVEGRDSIWGFYTRNQVRPLWLSMPERKVDVLIGNPPWVAYRFMTSALQEQYRAFSERYELWHGGKVATHQDLVALFIARSADKYLKDGGRMGFVTPLAVLSREQYEGFRSGRWGGSLRCDFTELWDLDKVRPVFFPVPSAVVFGTKRTNPTNKPGDEPPHGFPETKKVFSGLRVPDDWQATCNSMTVTEKPNIALGKNSQKQSVYDDVVRQGATITPRMMFFVTEEAHTMSRLGRSQGTTTVQAYRTKQEKEPWKSLPSWLKNLSSRFVFDVHLGATVVPFALRKPWRAVLPIDNQKLMSVEEIDKADDDLRQWWRMASQLWEENKGEKNKLSLMENLDYQRKLSKQLNAVKYRVVYTASGNSVAAARISDPRAVFEHKLYWMPARGLSEARYLTGILNAPVTTELVSMYQSRGLFGARDFDKNVWRLPIPQYDSRSELHGEIVELAEQAERVAAAVDGNQYGFQKHRKLVREALEAEGITEPLNHAVKVLLGED